MVEGAGQRFDYRSFPQMGHAMHSIDPALFATTLTEWALTLSRGRGGGDRRSHRKATANNGGSAVAGAARRRP